MIEYIHVELDAASISSISQDPAAPARELRLGSTHQGLARSCAITTGHDVQYAVSI